jgi:hypothetical protein
MAGLSNFITNTATQSTTMPTWYDTAQQNVVNQATQGAQNVPTLQNTVAGQGINQLSNPNTNPFTQAQGTLGQIATGAANPWITDTSGNVTPNTSTALGGLFQAQNQQLQQLMPNVQAQPLASAIGSGQFGSLRGQTAVDKAAADAQSKLFADQMQAALQNQQTGVQAGSAMGNVGSQGITSMTNLGQAQQADPLLAASALGKIIGGINAPQTVTNATQLSPLNQIGSIASALGGSVAGTNTLLKNLGVQGGLSGFLSKLGISGGLTPAQNPGGAAYNYGQDDKTQNALNSGMAPKDEEGNLMPGWSQTSNGSYVFGGGSGSSGGGGGETDTGGGGTLPPSTDTTDNGDYNGVDYSQQ